MTIPAWADLPEPRRAHVVNGLISAAVYNLQCVEATPLGGMEVRDPELLDRAEADIAAALALGWADDGTTRRLTQARDLIAARRAGRLPRR